MNLKCIMLAFSVALFSSCEQLSRLTQFDLTYDETVVVPSSMSVALPFDVATPDVETNSESQFSVNKTQTDLIEAISLKELKLNLKSPQTGDFSFLEAIHVFIAAESLPEKEIAWKTDIPDTIGNELVLDVTQADVMDYIKKDKFSLRVSVTTDELLTVDHEIGIHAVLHVDAKVLGL
ncbi:MAG: hypothetical protein PHI42_00105 [Paludibacteraceae bacterium]|nr:hypothetical protein [Paludibacteraceae bacterium]